MFFVSSSVERIQSGQPLNYSNLLYCLHVCLLPKTNSFWTEVTLYSLSVFSACSMVPSTVYTACTQYMRGTYVSIFCEVMNGVMMIDGGSE